MKSMNSNPVERSFVTRLFLSLAVIVSMSAGGAILAGPLTALGGPGAGLLGMGIGALAVFVLFAQPYSRHERRTD